MNISFKNDISSNYMVLEDVPDFKEDEFSFKMICENDIKGLLKFDYELINGKMNLLYDITGKEALGKKYNSSKMSFDELKNLIYSINSVLVNVKEYLLDYNNIVLKKECVFVDEDIRKSKFCYYPSYNGDFLLEIRELTAQILSFIDYSDPKVVRLAYYIQRKSQEDNFTIEEITNSFSEIIFDEEVYLRNENVFAMQEETVFETENNSLNIQMSRKEDSDGTEKSFELLDNKMESESKEKEDGFFDKAKIYFKITSPSDIYDDINHLKIFKKIKNVNAIANDVADENFAAERETKGEKEKKTEIFNIWG